MQGRERDCKTNAGRECYANRKHIQDAMQQVQKEGRAGLMLKVGMVFVSSWCYRASSYLKEVGDIIMEAVANEKV